MKIGVLALQGDFAEHHRALRACGAEAIAVRYPEQIDEIAGLVIPGGESTAVAKLTGDGEAPIFKAIQQRARGGMPVYGTCMGSIFLAREIEGSNQGRLGLMDIKVKRNAFGPQRKSFEIELDIPAISEGKEPFPAVFIRAPIIVSAGPTVKVLAQIAGEEDCAALGAGIVMARQGQYLVTAFHPEITGDLRVHRYFISMVNEYLATQVAKTREFDVNRPLASQ
jgi:pyridoxal 5'-phosphate synthase pdxT subunit